MVDRITKRLMAMKISRTSVVFLLAIAGFAAYLPAQEAVALAGSVGAIARGADSPGRRQAIVGRLVADGIPYRLEDFTQEKFAGTNIVATLPNPKAGRMLLLGAHYDRAVLGQGAVDNGAGCALVLSLLRRLKASPLANYSITAVFFDREENGLLGSQAYFARHAKDAHQPDHALNLDIFAYGDTFFGIESTDKGPLGQALLTAVKEAGLRVRVLPPGSSYPSGDQRSMMKAGLDTLGLGMIEGSDMDALLSGNEKQVRTLSIIHTERDTPGEIRPAEMDRGRAVLVRMLRVLDEGTGKSAE
jgi:hypothetical protein